MIPEALGHADLTGITLDPLTAAPDELATPDVALAMSNGVVTHVGCAPPAGTGAG